MGRKSISIPNEWTRNEEQVHPSQEPSENENSFDVRMADWRRGPACAVKILKTLKEYGFCRIEANAPQGLLAAAYEECENLWRCGAFHFPSQEPVESEKAASDEHMLWLNMTQEDDHTLAGNDCASLRMLGTNMFHFADYLTQPFSEEFDCIRWDSKEGSIKISCYTGHAAYRCHIDNHHSSCDDDFSITQKDNGMRLTLCFFLNPREDGKQCDYGGGIDMFDLEVKSYLKSIAAQRYQRFRVAPHADTLIALLSERVPYQVIPTTGSTRRYCMTLWCSEGAASQAFIDTLQEISFKQGDVSDLSGSEVE